jgi:hypothetical protein
VSSSLPYGALASSSEDMEDSEVEEGDCLGVSLGEPRVVEGAESAEVVEVAALRRTVRLGTAVEAMAEDVRVEERPMDV